MGMIKMVISISIFFYINNKQSYEKAINVNHFRLKTKSSVKKNTLYHTYDEIAEYKKNTQNTPNPKGGVIKPTFPMFKFYTKFSSYIFSQHLMCAHLEVDVFSSQNSYSIGMQGNFKPVHLFLLSNALNKILQILFNRKLGIF